MSVWVSPTTSSPGSLRKFGNLYLTKKTNNFVMSKLNTRAIIDANIRQNGQQLITGQVLNSVLNSMVTDYAEQAALDAFKEKVDVLALGAFYGYFPDSSSLPVDMTTPGYAYVGLDNPYKIWNFNGKSWSDSGTSIDMNDADEEDITRNADGKLQFKDRTYGDGMGYAILRKGKTFAEQVTKANTIYEIRYNFDLNGEQINIPSYSILFFNGGSLSNGTLSGNQSKIISKDLTIFKNGIVCLGEWENESVYSEWFDESYTNFRLICTNLIALCKEYGNVIIERDTFFKADDLQISLSKGINFDFKNTTLRLEERTITELNPVTPKYIFISNRQDKILRNLKFANLNIKAVANLQESGQFSGKTSGWGFIYISNIDNCTFENITFEHVATGFKVGYINGNDLGRKNIKFYRCSLTGKMLIQLFDVDNISIEDCVFDLSDTDNDLDHCLYLVTNNNVNIKKCTFKNAPSAINIWNASGAALKDDIVNVSITQSKVINSGFLNLLYASNANIDSVYIENALDISEYKGYTLFNIWRSHNITISNVYCSQDKLALKNVFNEADNVTYRNTYINAYMLSFEVQDSALNILNSQFSIKAYLDSHRLINGYGASRIRVCNCIFDINDTNASESIFIGDDTHFLLDNCNMLATGGSKRTLLLRLPTSKNAFIKNSYIEFRLTLLTIDQNPVVLNCKNANGEILDFPYIKFTDKSTIDKLAQYLSQYDAGFTTFDSTNKEPVLWDGATWIKINGDSIDANSIGTSAQRPTGVRDGFLYYDTTLKKYIVWNGTEWTNMDGTALG